MYKKIALACATIAAAGMLMIGCTKNHDINKTKINTELRERTYDLLNNIPEHTYKYCNLTITGKVSYESSLFGLPYPALELVKEDTDTGNTIRMIDYKLDGVDRVTYNGIRSETNGIDQEFDEALRAIKPSLEQKIKTEIEKVEENTKLK